jgi:hypothetical protein
MGLVAQGQLLEQTWSADAKLPSSVGKCYGTETTAPRRLPRQYGMQFVEAGLNCPDLCSSEASITVMLAWRCSRHPYWCRQPSRPTTREAGERLLSNQR